MKKILLILFVLISIHVCIGQTANNSVPSYTTKWQYGINLGYYANSLTDQNIAYIGNKVGYHEERLFLDDSFVTKYGYNARNTAFQYYHDSLGMISNVLNVGEQYSSNIPVSHLYDTTFAGCSEPARMWKGMYDSILLWNGNVNPTNLYANYIWNVLQNVGPYIQFVENTNEPDFTNTTDTLTGKSLGDAPKSYGPSWWNVAPHPYDLVNEQAPIYWLIRLQRICYVVTKKYNPNILVGTGGVGYSSFYDAMMRYTDNPIDGSVTTAYPLTGGAYFDADLFHKYAWYYNSAFNDSCFCFLSANNSDSLAGTMIAFAKQYDSVGKAHSYNNSTYPTKYLACTENGIGSQMEGTDFGNDSTAAWYAMKVEAKFQQFGCLQDMKFQTGSIYPAGGDIYNTMGVIDSMNNSSESTSNYKMNDVGYAMKTIMGVLYGYTYDAATTATLSNTDSTVELAFKNGSSEVFMCWASNHTNPNSEIASATITLPATSTTYTQKLWNYSYTSIINTVGRIVKVNSAPSFFLPTIVARAPKRLSAGFVNGLVNISWDSIPGSLQMCYINGCTTVAPVNVYTPINTGTLIINSAGYQADTLQVPFFIYGNTYGTWIIRHNELIKGTWQFINSVNKVMVQGNYNSGMNTTTVNVLNYPHGNYNFNTSSGYSQKVNL